MAKNKPDISMISYGIYTQWEERSRQLPKLIEATTDVPLRENIEFGFIVKVLRAKNRTFQYCIEHPDIPDKQGDPMAPFSGEVIARNNNWDFYLGDSVWLPVEDKAGRWRMSLSLDNRVVAEKTFVVEHEFYGERTLGQGRTHFKPKKRW